MHILTKSLTWAGLLPFVICLVWLALKLPSAGVAAETAFISYSVIILSFVAGSLWGNADHTNDSPHSTVMTVSNIWALVAWIVLMLHSQEAVWTVGGLALLALGYIHLYCLEATHLQEANRHDYLKLRKGITCGVVIAHLLMILLISL